MTHTPSAVVYLGAVHLSRYGYSTSASLGEVMLTLADRMPEDVWRLLGGSSGFTVDDHDAMTEGEVAIEVARLLATGSGEIWIGAYGPESLTVLVNPGRAFVMLLRADDDEGLLAGDPGAEGDCGDEAFTLSNGQVDEFERERTVTHDQAMLCVHSFLADRTLSADVRWIA